MAESVINGQVFKNTKGVYKTSHPSRSFYNKLKNYYCKKKGFIMCDEWLDFQNFASFWEKNVPTGATIKLDQSNKVIDKDSILIYKLG